MHSAPPTNSGTDKVVVAYTQSDGSYVRCSPTGNQNSRNAQAALFDRLGVYLFVALETSMPKAMVPRPMASRRRRAPSPAI